MFLSLFFTLSKKAIRHHFKMKPATTVVMVMSIIMMTSHINADKTAYSNDINKCLFDGWHAMGVLSKKVLCPDTHLCYSVNGNDPAQYAVCYNTKTLIPDFTGHVVHYDTKGATGRCAWHDENGPFGKYTYFKLNVVVEN